MTITLTDRDYEAIQQQLSPTGGGYIVSINLTDEQAEKLATQIMEKMK